jgi:general secretion pathway protein D
LGGYIKTVQDKTIDKVPFFGDIPIFGHLFRSKYSVDDKINLVIVITPYIIPKSKGLTFIRDKLARLKLLEDKYTKDTILRLEKDKLRYKKEDIKREHQLSRVKNQSSKIDDYTKEEKLTNEQLHKKRLKEIFGI